MCHKFLIAKQRILHLAPTLIILHIENENLALGPLVGNPVGLVIS